MPGDGVDGADGPGEDGAAEAVETAADASPAVNLSSAATPPLPVLSERQRVVSGW